MSEQDKLFRLIKTMGKGEKRAFKLFAQRYRKKDHLYVNLFDIIDRKEVYDEGYIRKKFIVPFKVGKQYPVVKNQLFNLVLASLRIQSGERFNTFKATTFYENAEILLSRGLYHAALSFLEKAEKLSGEVEDYPNILNILSKKSNIYRRILKAGELREKAAGIHRERLRIKAFLDVEHDLERIYQDVFHLHRTEGIAGTEELTRRYQAVKDACDERCQGEGLSVKARHYSLLTRMIYYYSTKDFEASAECSQQHLALFERHPLFLDTHPNEYLKALNNLIVIYTRLEKYEGAQQAIAKLEQLKQRIGSANRFVAQRIFEIKYSGLLSIQVEQRLVDEGLSLAPDIAKGLAAYHNTGMTADRNARLCFGIALLHFWKRDWNECLEWVERVEVQGDTAAYVAGYAKILKIISHFELGNHALNASLVKATHRYLKKHKRLFGQEALFLKYMDKMSKTPAYGHPGILLRLREEWRHFDTHPPQNSMDEILDTHLWLAGKGG